MLYAAEMADSMKKSHAAVDILSDEAADSVHVCMCENTIKYLVIRV